MLSFFKTPNYTSLVDNFNKNEITFQKLVEDFQAAISDAPCKNDYQISFGLGKDRKHINIFLRSYIISSTTKNIGGNDTKKGSDEYNMLLDMLNWDSEIVENLEKQLLIIGCDVIRNVNYYGGCKFQIYSYQDGFGSYLIYENPIQDINFERPKKPISNSDFGQYVRLD